MQEYNDSSDSGASSDVTSASGEESSDGEVMSDSGTNRAVDGIEDMVLSFLSQLATPSCNSHSKANPRESSDSESLQDKTRAKISKKNQCIKIALADRRNNVTSSNLRYLTYPRKCSKGSAKPIAQLFRLLDLAHEAIVEEIPSTKRDIYYKDVPLFKTQRTVDSLVDDLAATFELERSDLNIRATSKGLICGAGLIIHLLSEEIVRTNNTESILIPVGEDIHSFSIDTDIAWILLVEKDAVFQTLSHLRLADHPALPGRGLIITGKGYPDVATRHLVKTLSDSLPKSIPILALVDADPFGIDILSVYKYGSHSMQHENSKLAARRVKWLGLLASEMNGLGIDRDKLIPITKHDEKKALSMLRRPAHLMPMKWRKELMHMLHSRRKAEIEILSTLPSSSSTTSARSSQLQAASDYSLATTASNSASSSNYLTSSLSDDSDSFTPSSLFSSSQSFSSSYSNISSNESLHVPVRSHPQLTPLLQYLVKKISELVVNAQGRANSSSSQK